MKLRMLVAAAALATAGSVMADSAVVKDGYEFNGNQLIPSGVRAEVGTTGYGGALVWTANPKVDVVLGYNGGDISWSDDVEIDGSTYDLDMENNNVYVNAQIRPWANWFYMAAGAAYIDNDYDLDRRVSANRNFSVNGKDFTADNGGVRINGQMTYDNDIAPYVGIGFSPAINNRWGVFGEIGAYYTGNPTVTLRGTGNVEARQDEFEKAIEDEANKIANDDEYAWLPVAKLGLSFRF